MTPDTPELTAMAERVAQMIDFDVIPKDQQPPKPAPS